MQAFTPYPAKKYPFRSIWHINEDHASEWESDLAHPTVQGKRSGLHGIWVDRALEVVQQLLIRWVIWLRADDVVAEIS